MKNFFLASAKLAASLFLAGLALIAAVALYFWGSDYIEKRQAKQYEALTKWSVDLTKNLGLQLHAKTKVVAGMLLISVDVMGYPPYLSGPHLAERNQKAELLLHFVDADGFSVCNKPIKVSEFSDIVGVNGEKVGLRTQLQERISVDNYKRFQRLQVEWTLETKLPKESKVEAKEEKTHLDHCALGISRTERLERLSQYGELRETSSGSYAAGGRSVHFFHDGSLLNCR